MQVLLIWLGSALAKIFTDKVLKYIAMKTILVFLLTIVVPVILNNFLYDIIEIVLNFANSQSQNNFNGGMSFSGFAAWLINCFQLPAVFAVLISALVLRTSLRMIPFIRL